MGTVNPTIPRPPPRLHSPQAISGGREGAAEHAHPSIPFLPPSTSSRHSAPKPRRSAAVARLRRARPPRALFAPLHSHLPRRAISSVELSMARERGGDWDGSNVHEDHITFLRETRRLPGAGHMKARVPRRERSHRRRGRVSWSSSARTSSAASACRRAASFARSSSSITSSLITSRLTQ